MGGAALAAMAFVPGLALGSFLNVVAARVPLRRSVVHPGSACMACETPLAWYDNVPIVSWALLGARCRHCGTSIPWKYPLVELVTALLIGACVLAFGLTADAAVASLFCAALVAISVTDFERNVIPNRIVLPTAAIVLASQTALHPSPEWALGAFGAFLFLFIAAFAYPAGLGMGGVPLDRGVCAPRRYGDGRRQARPAARRDARPDSAAGNDDRDDQRARARDGSPRPPRRRRAQDG